MTDFVDDFKKLSDNQQKAIPLILTGETNKSVAKKLGVDENTVYRWRNSEPFKNLLISMRMQIIEDIDLKLNNLGNMALNKLEYLLENACNENNQLKASIFILENIAKASQLEIIKRIDEIEERLMT